MFYETWNYDHENVVTNVVKDNKMMVHLCKTVFFFEYDIGYFYKGSCILNVLTKKKFLYNTVIGLDFSGGLYYYIRSIEIL